MPSKYLIREFVENGHYHIFNRGNRKKAVFRDHEDYCTFLSFLEEYLSPPRKNCPRKNFANTISLFAFCLMPNHFHLALKQHAERAITSLLQCLMIRYAKYFNEKYNTVGHIFQDKYKSRLITTDSDIIHLTRYIHLNPQEITNDVATYPYSSFSYYIKNAPDSWIKPSIAMDVFSDLFGLDKATAPRIYKNFVMELKDKSDPGDPFEIGSQRGV